MTAAPARWDGACWRACRPLGGALRRPALAPGVERRGGATLAYMWDVTLFTLLQAGLERPAVGRVSRCRCPGAGRRPGFPGRALLLRLFALPMALPVLVGVIGILGIYGQAGVLNPAGAQWLGLESCPSIYGLAGIVLAHVFYNLPLATLAPAGAARGDSGRRRGGSPRRSALVRAAVFSCIDGPALREVLPRVASLVFMLAVASFTIVLTLGGGPGATTLEVAIYQALRFDFDPGLAARLALVQMAISAVVGLAAGRWAMAMVVEPVIGKVAAGRSRERVCSTGSSSGSRRCSCWRRSWRCSPAASARRCGGCSASRSSIAPWPTSLVIAAAAAASASSRPTPWRLARPPALPGCSISLVS